MYRMHRWISKCAVLKAHVATKVAAVIIRAMLPPLYKKAVKIEESIRKKTLAIFSNGTRNVVRSSYVYT